MFSDTAGPGARQQSDLPAELWHRIAELVVAAYIDEYLSRIPGVDGVTLHNMDEEPAPHPVASLLRVTYTARHVTLRLLAQYLGIEYLPSGAGRLAAPPAARLALVLGNWREQSDDERRAASGQISGAHGPVLAAYVGRTRGVLMAQGLASVLPFATPSGTGAQQVFDFYPKFVGYSDSAHVMFCAMRDALHDETCPAAVRTQFAAVHAPFVGLLDAFSSAVTHACCFATLCKHLAANTNVPPSHIPVVFNHGPVSNLLDKLAEAIAQLPVEYAIAQSRADGAQHLAVVDQIIGGRPLELAISSFAQLAALELPNPAHEGIPAAARACEQIAIARRAALGERAGVYAPAYAVGTTDLVPLPMPEWAPGAVRAAFLWTVFVVAATWLV